MAIATRAPARAGRVPAGTLGVPSLGLRERLPADRVGGGEGEVEGEVHVRVGLLAGAAEAGG